MIQRCFFLNEYSFLKSFCHLLTPILLSLVYILCKLFFILQYQTECMSDVVVRFHFFNKVLEREKKENAETRATPNGRNENMNLSTENCPETSSATVQHGDCDICVSPGCIRSTWQSGR